jgi:hypothetical protein
MNVYQHARNYIAAAPPAISGQGGHDQTLAIACSLIKGFDFSINEARPLLQEYNERCDPPWSVPELEHKLRSADALPDTDKFGVPRARGWLRNDRDRPEASTQATIIDRASPAPAIPAEAKFEQTTLQKFAAPWRGFVETAWLANRSAINPYGVSSDAFLRSIFRQDEHTVVFTDDKSQGQALWPKEELPEIGRLGVWFLNQPVNGEYRENDEGNMSRRSKENVIDWRYLVIESDKADPRDWLAALVQLPLAITAIYTSGSQSIHALVRVDMPTKQAWDSFAKAMRPILVTLGADRKTMTAVRLTRLPGSFREGKMKKDGDGNEHYHKFSRPHLQKLLYLDPEPDVKAICLLKPRRDVLASLRATAETMLKTPIGEIFEREKCQNFDECISSLDAHEKLRIDPQEAQRQLRWFESSPTAHGFLTRIRQTR